MTKVQKVKFTFELSNKLTVETVEKMDIKNLIQQLGQRAGLSAAELESSIENGTFSENQVTAFTSNLMNLEAATANQDLRNRVLGTTLGAIDENLISHAAQKYGELLPGGFLTEIKAKGKTSEKAIGILDALAASFDQKIEAFKGKEGASVALQAELTNAGEALTAMRNERDQAQAAIKTLKQSHHSDKVRVRLESLVSSKKLNGPNAEVNAVLRDKIINDVMTKADFTFNDSGNLIPLVKGTDQTLLNQSTQQVDLMGSLIDPVGLPYFAKSDPKPQDQQSTTIPTTTQGTESQEQRDRYNALPPAAKQRLAELQQKIN